MKKTARTLNDKRVFKTLNPKFSHIYIEKGVLNNPLSQKILFHFPKSKIIEIDHYKDFFCRPRQDFVLQKKTPKLILATQRTPFLYERARPCHWLGYQRFFYTSEIVNCLFDCEYCFLQGLYPSGNIIIFVNQADIKKAVKEELENGPLMLSISYNTDLLVFEKLTGMVEGWINFASKHPDITIELRTKSSIVFPFIHKDPLNNFQLSWSLSPNYAVNSFEHQTPSAEARIKAIKKVTANGWKVRLCFDPIIPFTGWKQKYEQLIENVFAEISTKEVIDVTIGPFRMSKEHLKQARKRRPDSLVLAYPYKLIKDIYSYPAAQIEDITKTISGYISKHLDKERIHAAI